MLRNIEAERGRLGLSKEAISKKLNITSATYNNYIGGKPIPSDVLIAMADIFDCRIDYLLGITDTRTA
jgi:transcriptional regulator with XRE-family HTH domain